MRKIFLLAVLSISTFLQGESRFSPPYESKNETIEEKLDFVLFYMNDLTAILMQMNEHLRQIRLEMDELKELAEDFQPEVWEME